MNAQFLEIIEVPILGWAARPSADTTIGALGAACRDLNLTVLLLDNEVHLALGDPNNKPPSPEELVEYLHGEAGMIIQEVAKPPALVNIENQAAS